MGDSAALAPARDGVGPLRALHSHAGRAAPRHLERGLADRGDPPLDRIDRFNEIFGNDDFVNVLYDAGDFFQPGPVARLEALTRALEDEVPHLLDAAWPEAGLDPLAGWMVD